MVMRGTNKCGLVRRLGVGVGCSELCQGAVRVGGVKFAAAGRVEEVIGCKARALHTVDVTDHEEKKEGCGGLSLRSRPHGGAGAVVAALKVAHAGRSRVFAKSVILGRYILGSHARND